MQKMGSFSCFRAVQGFFLKPVMAVWWRMGIDNQYTTTQKREELL